VGHTQETDASLAPVTIANVDALLDGRVPPMLRNPEGVTAWARRLAGDAADGGDAGASALGAGS
jgi:hypothetical protein